MGYEAAAADDLGEGHFESIAQLKEERRFRFARACISRRLKLSVII